MTKLWTDFLTTHKPIFPSVFHWTALWCGPTGFNHPLKRKINLFSLYNELYFVFCYLGFLVAEELPSNGVSEDDSVFEDNQSFLPPPPPPTEISLLEVPPKTPPSAEAFQINELDIWPSVTALPVQVSADKELQESVPDKPLQNGQALNKPPDESLQSPSSVKEIASLPPSPSAIKAPPLPTKPKPKLWVLQLNPVHHHNLVLMKSFSVESVHMLVQEFKILQINAL